MDRRIVETAANSTTGEMAGVIWVWDPTLGQTGAAGLFIVDPGNGDTVAMYRGELVDLLFQAMTARDA